MTKEETFALGFERKKWQLVAQRGEEKELFFLFSFCLNNANVWEQICHLHFEMHFFDWAWPLLFCISLCWGPWMISQLSRDAGKRLQQARFSGWEWLLPGERGTKLNKLFPWEVLHSRGGLCAMLFKQVKLSKQVDWRERTFSFLGNRHPRGSFDSSQCLLPSLSKAGGSLNILPTPVDTEILFPYLAVDPSSKPSQKPHGCVVLPCPCQQRSR